MHIVIFTGGIVDPKTPVAEISKTAHVIIGVDSGYQTALKFGIKPHILIGDLDSITCHPGKSKKTKRDSGVSRKGDSPQNDNIFDDVKVISFPPNKNETDTELGIEEAIKHGATKITIFGGIEGNRIDHILANIFLLSSNVILSDSEGSRQEEGRDSSSPRGTSFAEAAPSVQNDKSKPNIYFINGRQTIWLKKGPATEQISGNPGDLLSLIALNGDVTNVTTENLKYQLKNETLFLGKPRGISNVLLKETARVKFEKGMLLFILTKH